mmetsp:Transcript_4768/g.12288  ORF Transcript_4768/g.12288 Transcript_4768/m.12288 type:complete len:363 (+) Transcript_4768:163-1251(+)
MWLHGAHTFPILLWFAVMGAQIFASHTMITHISRHATDLANATACHLQLADAAVVKAPKAAGNIPDFCRGGQNKFTSKHCMSQPPLDLSAGCNAVDIFDPSWYTGRHRKEIVLVGDSVMEQLYRQMVCLVHASSPHRTASKGRGLLVNPGDYKDNAVTYSRGLKKRSCRKECYSFGSLRICHYKSRADVLDAKVAPCLLQARPNDVYLFNVGVWHHRPETVTAAIINFRTFIHQAKANGHILPRLAFRESSPQHFKTIGGHFASGPRGRGCLERQDTEAMAELEFRNRAAVSALKDLDIDVMYMWELLKPWPQHHVGAACRENENICDCTHWCESQPGSIMKAMAKLTLSDLLQTYFTDTRV